MPDRKLKVFLSSTARDLTAFRKAVHARLVASPLFECIRQEEFFAQPHPPVTVCREQVSKADLFVGLIGMRRGWEPADDNSDHRSITEMEYEWAKDVAPRFMYTTPRNFPVPGDLRESEDEHRRQLDFRQRVMNELVVSQEGFASPEALATLIVDRLTDHVLNSDLLDRVRPQSARGRGAHSRAVFFGRDGVLNKAFVRNGKPYSPDTIEEMILVPNATEALRRLRDHGFRLIVATNQPDIARGRLTRAQVDTMNAYLQRQLPLDSIEVCPHDDFDNCDCRKPKPGLLLNAAHRNGINLPDSFMIGDRWRDIEAGRAAGCRTVLIGDGYGEHFRAAPEATVDTLTEAADWILLQSSDHSDLADHVLAQRPAAFRFAVRNGQIDVLREAEQTPASQVARDLYDELRAKSHELAEQLARTDAHKRVRQSIDRLMTTLGTGIEDVRPGLLLSRSRSLEADRTAFNTPEGRRELFPDAIARMNDLLLTLHDLLGLYPEVQQIEAEQFALAIPRDASTAKLIRKNTDAIKQVAAESGAATSAAVAALKEHDADIGTARNSGVRASLIADHLLVVRNFASETLRAVRGASALAARTLGPPLNKAGSELRGLSADSWQQVREHFPKGIGRAAEAAPTGALVALLIAIAGPIGGLGILRGGGFKELAKAIGKFARPKVVKKKKSNSSKRAPAKHRSILGHAHILEIFSVSKVGKIAGCRVTDGRVERDATMRLIRDSAVIHEGKLSQLKRFKDDVDEVFAGQECGMALEDHQDMRPGDVIECSRLGRVQRSR